jgi:cytochrome c biogenesis protein CcmG, thiol:disulfide interchange protein DsbE
MTTRGQWLVVLAIVAVLGGGLAVATLALGDELFTVEAGTRAPEIAAVTLDVPPVKRTLADYKGSVVMLNVWATWCAPCEWEMPSMERLHRSYADSGLRIVAVSIDDPGREDAIREFVARHELTFDVLHDPAKRIIDDYRTSGVPETFVIGRDGVIRRKTYTQDWNTPANRALISQLLHEGVAPGTPAGGPGTDEKRRVPVGGR